MREAKENKKRTSQLVNDKRIKRCQHKTSYNKD
jgi:hypothetical protein